jgi:hypothetical protein
MLKVCSTIFISHNSLAYLPHCVAIRFAFIATLSSIWSEKTKEVAPQQKSMQADVDFSDPELEDTMEIFNAMSPEEMQEPMVGLLDVLCDDPEVLAAIQELQKELETMKASGVEYNDEKLQDMIADDELLAAATQDFLDMVESATDWEPIWEMQEVILQSVLESGQLSAQDAALDKSDLSASEKELKFIWKELQNQDQLQKQFQQKEQQQEEL